MWLHLWPKYFLQKSYWLFFYLLLSRYILARKPKMKQPKEKRESSKSWLLTDGTMKHVRADISRLPYDMSPQQDLPSTQETVVNPVWKYSLSNKWQRSAACFKKRRRGYCFLFVFFRSVFINSLHCHFNAQSIQRFFSIHFNRFIQWI
jgi:hypothetical protein